MINPVFLCCFYQNSHWTDNKHQHYNFIIHGFQSRIFWFNTIPLLKWYIWLFNFPHWLIVLLFKVLICRPLRTHFILFFSQELLNNMWQMALHLTRNVSLRSSSVISWNHLFKCPAVPPDQEYYLDFSNKKN